MRFVARSVRYVLRKRVRTIVLLIILTIINGEHAIHDRGFSGSSTGRRTNREGSGRWIRAVQQHAGQHAHASRRRHGAPRRRAQDRPTAPGSIRIWSVRTPPPISWEPAW